MIDDADIWCPECCARAEVDTQPVEERFRVECPECGEVFAVRVVVFIHVDVVRDLRRHSRQPRGPVDDLPAYPLAVRWSGCE